MKEKSGGEFFLRLLAPAAGLLLIALAMALAFFQQDNAGMALYAGLAGAALFLTIFFTWEKGNLLNYLHFAIYVVLTTGSMALLYLIAAKHPKQWDLTRDKTHSLSGQTMQYIRALQQSVRIVAFVDNEQKSEAERFLDQYKKLNPSRVQIEVVDPVRDPVRARAFDENVYPGDYYVIREESLGDKAEAQGDIGNKLAGKGEMKGDKGEKKDKKQKKVSLGAVKRDAESQITNAIIEVVRDQTLRLYFLTGHGEKPLDRAANTAAEARDESLSDLRKILEERAYPCESLNLLSRGTIPEDCAALVLAGPRRDLFDLERDMIFDYLREGGKWLVLFDPVLERNSRMPNIRSLLHDYGVETQENSIIADLVSAQLPIGPLSPIPQEFGNHAIVQGMTSGSFYFLESRAFTQTIPEPSGSTIVPLFKTGHTSWAADFDDLLSRGGRLRPPDSGGSPQILGMAITKNASGSRGTPKIVVFGDSDAFTGPSISNTTALLFLQSCNWLAEQKDLLAIPPKALSETPINLSGAQLLIISFALGIVVLIVLFGGLSYTILRRKLG